MSIQKTKRIKIPADIEAEVLFQSNRLCCVDQKRGDHMHHVDGNNSNNEFDNLALLCFDCHNEATVTGSLRKKLTPKAIIKFREHHYEVIQNDRNNSLKKLYNPIGNLTSEDLILAATSALILMEITRIKQEYYECILMDRNYIIQKLNKFSEFNNSRIAFEVFSFLSLVSYETRSGIPTKMAQTIFSLTTKFFPGSNDQKNNEQLIEIGNQCIGIAGTLVYDSTIHFKNFNITCLGLLILKFLYIKSKKLQIPQLSIQVKNKYSDLQNHLNRPERTDLADAKRLLTIFLSDLENFDLSFPVLPKDLQTQID